eukprot:CAMPEP_0184396070 /NCGR_PEP_ID=MMETSP0007-20130409/46740_1 /TAXON_ID=97485 /ORGANISM="Prymnesium parvum, Strain Texoma1" /LENGTH=43 /DNA_ID= /DNA_START= /DNA_END= /DNA_ORIENTATION=
MFSHARLASSSVCLGNEASGCREGDCGEGGCGAALLHDGGPCF